MSLMRADGLRIDRRVLGMGLPEMAGRSRQEASRWLDRTGMTRCASARRTSLFRCRSGSRPLGAIASSDRKPPTSRQCRRGARLGDGVRKDVLAQADRLCDGHFDLLGYRGLSFGDPIDWHLDPVSGRRRRACTGAASTRSIPRGRRQQGHLGAQSPPVARASRRGVPPHRRRAIRRGVARVTLARGWPPIRRGIGINWASSLEVALRLIAWCWTLELFRQSPELLRSAVRARSLAAICDPRRARRAIPLVLLLAEHASDRRSARTLLRRRRCFPSTTRAGRWRELARAFWWRRARAKSTRRRVLRAVHLLPALHGRDLSPFPDSRGAQRLAGAAGGRRTRPGDARFSAVGPPSERIDAADWRFRRRMDSAARSCARQTMSAACLRRRRPSFCGPTMRGPPAGRSLETSGCWDAGLARVRGARARPARSTGVASVPRGRLRA